MDENSLKAVGWARSLPLDTEVRAARAWTRGHLDTLGWTRTAPATADDVLLTVSELVTNAHVHAHSTAHLLLTWDHECLHVTVHDCAPALPEPREAGPEATGGRGMLLVGLLADTWDVHPCRHGKDVTACFRPPEQGAARETAARPE
ncbi:ATP-binding protein [Streptomyces sp. P6-2-1]|uniref:ATP-binding protein n=1 Tax=unclassified Streptomyces TaxID=2593676 RepID=UPI003D35C540